LSSKEMPSLLTEPARSVPVELARENCRIKFAEHVGSMNIRQVRWIHDQPGTVDMPAEVPPCFLVSRDPVQAEEAALEIESREDQPAFFNFSWILGLHESESRFLTLSVTDNLVGVFRGE